MARTNIEEEAWARIYRLAEIQAVSVREAAGTAACLWHQSQSLVKAFGTREEVLEWASLHNVSDQDAEKWLNSLKKARLVSDRENGLFSINGNEVQIESMISKTTRATKGGQALKKKLSELKRLKASLKPAASLKQGAPRGSNQIKSNQVNANQNKSTQVSALQSNASATEPSATSPSEKSSGAISVYCQLWKSKYNARPVIAGKESGIIKTLINDLGEKRVVELIEGYLRHPGAYFAQRRHDLGTFRTSLQDIAHFIDTGAFVNRKQLQEVEEQQHYSAKNSMTSEQQEELRKILGDADRQLALGGK